MKYRHFAYVVAVLGFTLIGLHMFLSKHVLSFHGPVVGGEFRKSEHCQEQAEALFLSLHVAGYLHKGWSFGLAEAGNSITTDDCIETSTTQIDHALIAMIQKQSSEFHTEEPNWLLSREIGRAQYLGVVPRWPLGLLYSVLSNQDDLSSHKGVIWYLRCDYSLGLEPFRSFMLSNLHIERLDAAAAARMEECGAADTFHSILGRRLITTI